MNSKTRMLIQEIKKKVKSPVTGANEFSSDDTVIEFAVQKFYELLKQKRIL